MKINHLLFILILFILSCSFTLVRDEYASPMDTKYYRVETEICGVNEIGLNGCAFKDGVVSSNLKIYNVLKGSLRVQGANCGIDQSIQYDSEVSEFTEIDLKSIGKLERDCVINIVQDIKYPHQDGANFPVRGMAGIVTLGSCPGGTLCNFSVRQKGITAIMPRWEVQTSDIGDYMVRGCGEQVVPVTGYDQDISVELNDYINKKFNCIFIMSVRGSSTLEKRYYHVSVFGSGNTPLSVPIFKKGNRITVISDKYTAFLSINGKISTGNSARFKSHIDGDIIRAYTSNGRSLKVFYKDGIQWIK